VRRVAAILIGFASVAHAEDPHDVFGLKPTTGEAPLDCSDGKAFGCAQATDPLDDVTPYALRTWFPASYLLSLPTADDTQVDVASYALGASRDNAGVSFRGATGLENRWTIDGAPADGLRTGAADTHVPLVFLDGLLVEAGGFSARDRVSTGGTIDAQLIHGTKDHEVDARVWLGWTADPRRFPPIPQTYNVRTGTVTPGPDATVSLVATGPIAHDWWYAAGIAPSIARTHFAFRAATLQDADQDGTPDGLPGVVTTDLVEHDSRTETTYDVPVMLRSGWDRGPHHLELTAIGEVFDDTSYLYNATLQAAGVDGTNLVGDAIATWKSEWHDTHLRVQAAWHRSQRREHAHDALAGKIPQLLSAYVPDTLAEDPALAGACSDMGADPYPNIPNCPIPIGWFASGGAGALVDTTGDRPSITADLAHQIDNHVLRIGATGEDTRLVTETRFTGGRQIRSLFPMQTTVRQFLDPNTPCLENQPCPTVDASTLTWRTRYTAAYAEDTWHPAANLQVDGGVRWELMWVGSTLHFSNQLAPRLGVTYDPLGGGRSRVWVSMGRSFALLPAGLGPTVLSRDRYVDNISSPFGQARDVETGAVFAVAPGITAMKEDELTAGAELALAKAIRGTVWAQGAWLHDGIDTTPDGFDNPGKDGGLSAERSTALVGAEVSTSPLGKLVLRVGYMYGHTTGTWTGPFNPNEGAVLYSGADFDFESINQAGPLATDVGHRTYIEAQTAGRVGPVKLAFATRLTVGSGKPRDVLANSDEGLINLLPRGSFGRGTLLTQANVRVAATWRGVDLVLDVFNLFDRRDTTSVDERYSGTGANPVAVHPIEGGAPSDLVFLRTEGGSPAVRNPGFQLPTSFQPPLSVMLGLRTRF
jgi:hypothetical protein